MTRAEIFEVLKANLCKVVEGARGKEISEEFSMKDYAADSLEMVEVVSRSMKELKIKIPRTSLSTAKNLKELIDLFEQHAAANATATIN